MTLYDYASGDRRYLQDASNRLGRVWLYRKDLLEELGDLHMLTGQAKADFDAIRSAQGVSVHG